MRRCVFLLSIVVVLCFSANAKVLSPAQAMQRAAAQDINLNGQQVRFTINAADQKAALYVVDTEQGFAVIAADDCTTPVLGWSDRPLIEGDPLPQPLIFWLDHLASQVSAAREHDLPMRTVTREYAPIAPMLATKWDQEAPYYNKCPMINRKRCLTGCTATAMAQVLRYHRWPENGTGQHSYNWNGNTYSFDYENTPFNYDLMLDTYGNDATAEQKDAVATLMYGCGVAADMQYHPDASGAYLTSAYAGLIRNLRYSSDAYVADREIYSVQEWEDRLYRSLEMFGPTIYCGYTLTYDGMMSEGHTFVIDGYSSDGYFHINWGWSGYGDGYFMLNALDTYGNGTDVTMGAYGARQQAIFNLHPDDGRDVPEPLVKVDLKGFQIETEYTSIGGEITWSMGLVNLSDIELKDVRPGLCILEGRDEEPIIRYIYSDETFDLAIGQIKKGDIFTVTLPTDLDADRTAYVLRSAYRYADTDYLIYAPDNYYFVDAYSPEIIHLWPPGPGVPLFARIDDLEVDPVIYIGKPFSATFNITAYDEFNYPLTVVLTTEKHNTATAVDAAEYVSLHLKANEDTHVNYIGTMRNAEPGTYWLSVAMPTPREWGWEERYIQLSEPVEWTVMEAPEEEFAMEISDISFSAVKDNEEDAGGTITAHFTAKCTSGYKYAQIYMDYYTVSGNKMLGSEFSNAIPFSAGTEREVTLACQLSSMQVDVPYFCRIMTYDNAYGRLVDRHEFTLDEITVGIGTIVTDNVTGREYYDLNGLRVSDIDTAPTGIYIEVTRHPNGNVSITKRMK